MAKYTPGIAGIWIDEHKVVSAARKLREMGYNNVDAVTPYAVHGMEEALGIKRSGIPYVAFIMGLVGMLSGLALTYWTSAVDWPLNIGGKPAFSLPAFIPIIFELTILFAALSSVAALFFLCRLPKKDPPVIDLDVTCHKFAIFIPKTDVGYSEDKIASTYKELGAIEVKKMAGY
jgi:hypothetical protein